METTNRNSEGQQQAASVLRGEDKVLPVKKFSTGAISATVWRNQRQGRDGKVFETHSVNLQRRYANKDGQWMTSNSLRVTDLPKAALVLEEAYKYLVLSGKSEEPSEN